MRRAVLIGVGVFALGIAAIGGCGGNAGTGSSDDSGIRGAVVIGPTCPVEAVSENCADKPYVTKLRFVDASSGKQAAVADSGANGRFDVALPAGRYRIEPESSGSPPSAAAVEVNVPRHAYATATIRFDSGIR